MRSSAIASTNTPSRNGKIVHVIARAIGTTPRPAAAAASTATAPPAAATGHSGAPRNDTTGYAHSTIATDAITTLAAPDSGGVAGHAPSAGAGSASTSRNSHASTA